MFSSLQAFSQPLHISIEIQNEIIIVLNDLTTTKSQHPDEWTSQEVGHPHLLIIFLLPF